jgi:uncharacterized protein
MNITRAIKSELKNRLEPHKVVIIYGPRRVGKTTLLEQILSETTDDYLYLSGEDRLAQDWLSSQSIEILKQNIGSKKLIAIDEAQKIDQIGLNLKLIVDHIKDIRVIATGSSSFELANQIGEPLVGRKWQFILYPIAQLELNPLENLFETKAKLESRLIYGSYPEVIIQNDLKLKQQLLHSLVDNYLYRDLLELENIKKSQKILDLLKLIAFQIGQEVSIGEVANSLNLNERTIEKYLDLLAKVFVVKRVYGFSRNLRKEVTKTSRYYFYDNGVRNAIINNFNDLNTRNDIGQLWENYLFMERLKKQAYLFIFSNNYFWRTYDKKEIDLVEERAGKLFGFEFKWGDKAKKAPKDWLETYSNAEYQVINKNNYLEFIA